ncbi:MAG: hypothetical protein EBW47_06215 [Betaproteobacteria bacterium]|nr:hypothetical protein [Betaproteobacteria bacterium]
MTGTRSTRCAACVTGSKIDALNVRNYWAENAETLQDLQKYWDFTLAIFFGFGLTFEVPVVQMLLVKVGLVSTQQLREARRYVIVGAFVVAAVLTPPDVLSQFMLAVPLLLLYELGIFLSGFVTARSRAPSDSEAAKAGDVS